MTITKEKLDSLTQGYQTAFECGCRWLYDKNVFYIYRGDEHIHLTFEEVEQQVPRGLAAKYKKKYLSDKEKKLLTLFKYIGAEKEIEQLQDRILYLENKDRINKLIREYGEFNKGQAYWDGTGITVSRGSNPYYPKEVYSLEAFSNYINKRAVSEHRRESGDD